MNAARRSSAPAFASDERRSPHKHAAILEAATIAFLRSGYLGTSMDQIASLAGVSKQTVYKHFADKEQLFSEIVVSTLNEASDPIHEEAVELRDSGAVEADLRDLARRQLAAVIQPRVVQLRRLVIGEVARFPDLGRIFYERGQGRTIPALAAALERLAARGLLELDDPTLAATHFHWLILSAPVNRAMLLGDTDPLSPAELDRYADGGVRAFLSMYGAGSPDRD